MTPGDLVLIRYPFDEVEEYKKRPVLVVAVVHDTRDPDVIVLQITSSATLLADPKAGDIITDDPALRKRSVIRARRIFSLRQSQVIRELGAVAQDTFDEAKAQLRTILAM